MPTSSHTSTRDLFNRLAAERILVLDGGRIAAEGRHDELLKTSLLYRRMCARLSVGKSLDDPETVDELMRAARR